MDLRDIYRGLNGAFSSTVVILCAVALARMFSRISKTSDLKVHRTGKNALGKIDESGPFSQALPGAFHDEAPFSGSFNVSMESKGKNVDISLSVTGTPRCDEAKRSEGQDVDVNLNISGAPRCDEAPSSSSSSGPTKSRSDLISSKRKDKVEDVNLDDLWKHIFELRKLRENGNHKKARRLGHFPWPNVPGLQELEETVSLGSDLLVMDIYGTVKAILGRVNVATVAPLLVAHTLEKINASITNRKELWHLTIVMYDLAIVLKGLSESPEGMQDVMQEATSWMAEAARMLSLKGGRRRLTSEVIELRNKLTTMYIHIDTEFTVRVLLPIQYQRRSHLSKEYPTDAVEVKDVYLDDLWKHISELWTLREKGNHEKARSLRHFPWPDVPGLQKLKEIVSFGTDLPIEEIHGAVKAILEEIGRVNVATAAPLVLAHTLERVDASIANRGKFWHLIKEMYDLAIVLLRLSESSEGMQDVMQEATSLIIEGALLCSTHVGHSSIGLLYSRSVFERDLSEFRQKLNAMYMHIITEITVRVFTLIQHQLRSHLSKEYPTHAGAPRCDEAPSSSSSSGPTKSRSDLISSKRKDEVEDVNLDDLWKHIFELRKSREKGNHQEASILGHFPWPNVSGLRKLEEIVSFGPNLFDDILGPVEALPKGAVKTILQKIGWVNVATAASLVVAHTLERLDASITNREKCWHLIKEMYDLAIVLKRLRESAEGMQDVMQEATSLIIEGALVCSTQIGRSRSEFERDLSEFRQKLNAMYMHMNAEITVRVFPLIQHQRRSHLSKECPTHPDNGQVEEDLLLTVPQKVHINTGQVEEDMPELEDEDMPELEDEDLPEPQKADIHNNVVVYNAIFWTLFQWVFPVKIWSQFIGITSLIVSFCTIKASQRFSRMLNPNIQLKNHFNCNKSKFNLNFFHRIPSPKSPKNRIIDNSIHNNEPVEEDLVFTERQKAYIRNGQVDEDLLSTGRPKVFKMEALVAATNNFHEDNKVGEGGFGAVYKGTHDGKQIAVKKMSFKDEGSREFMKKQFENEKLLAEFQHRNIVNLLGSCEQESQGFLVYEYLPNGSLDKVLFDADKRKLLDWHKRDNIIQGIAQGLCYLHEDCQVRIVHRDIKASNILLDEKMNAQITDFGTANLFPQDRTHVTTTSPVGTTGYMAPEYFMTKQFTAKTDVYSFGIVLLELLTGEKISSNALESLGRVWRLYKRKEALQTIDPTIIETSDKEAAKALRCIQVGLLCIQQHSWLRPTMSEVIAMLSTYESLPEPMNPPCLPSYGATQENGNSAMEKLMFNRE